MADPRESQKAKSITPLKLIAFSVAGLLVGLGMCGAGSKLHDATVLFFVAGIVCLALSALGLISGVIWEIAALLAAIFERRRL